MDEIIFNDSKGKLKMKLTNDQLVITENPNKKEKEEKQKKEELDESSKS